MNWYDLATKGWEGEPTVFEQYPVATTLVIGFPVLVIIELALLQGV